jgi:NAD-dependent dihydropyrimidine dehydrogenase PreA subunit
MKEMRYIENMAALTLDPEKCVGCHACETVCPHSVFGFADGKAVIEDRDGCMECGACALNCPADAITVTPGVGCAALIIKNWIKKVAPNVNVGDSCC